MAFPPRPPPGMMPGLPPGPPPVLFGVVPPPPIPTHLPAPPIRQIVPFITRPTGPPPSIPNASGGPSVTVFVGNLSERAPDAMIRSILGFCGPIINWKRVQGATGKLQGFGFCEYGSPDHALRAIRLLHDYEIADKKLVVKVDEKTRIMLNDYNKKLRESASDSSPKSDTISGDFMNDDIKTADKTTKEQIVAILKEHAKEIQNYVPSDNKKKPYKIEENDGRFGGPKQSLDDVDMEDNKRTIINREIDKFREIMKLREAEKEEEKKKKEEDADKPSKKSTDASDREKRDSSVEIEEIPRPRNDKTSKRCHSPSRSVSKGRSVSPKDRSSRSRSHRTRERKSASRSRSRSRDRRDRDRSVRDSPARKSTKEIWKEQDVEEEAKDRKKAERKARDKEASYQERLRKWEERESRKVKELQREKERDEDKKQELERDSRKIRMFMRNYNDDRDDIKHFKGFRMEQRLVERQSEAKKDLEDRLQEKEETELLRQKIVKEGHKDVDRELERRVAERDRLLYPGIKRVIEEVIIDDDPPEEESNGGLFQNYTTTTTAAATITTIRDFTSGTQVVSIDDDRMDDDDDDHGDHYDAGGSPTYSHGSNDNADDYGNGMSSQSPISTVPLPPTKQSFQMTTTRRKIETRGVFNQDDDETIQTKKLKLPIPVLEAVNAATGQDKRSRDPNDDKKRHIRSIIDKIPTAKSALFDYKISWNLVDEVLMEKRIKPWVNKKITEYIGEPEPSLTDFICSKVLAYSSPKEVLEDVQMVLDEEAEVFVVKLWRLLIYEVENKKMKDAMGIVE